MENEKIENAANVKGEVTTGETKDAEETVKAGETVKAEENVKAETKEASFKVPTSEELQSELDRERYKARYRRNLRSTIGIFITAAAAAVLIATLILPIFRIYGVSMTPTLASGDIVVAVKGDNFKRGELLAFYYNNKILVKRVIAREGEWVNIDQEGNVYVNDQLLEEPYLTGKSLGKTDLTYPYQVPSGEIFVMGDHRDVSIDSRESEIGCISSEQIAGRLTFRLWPLNKFGRVK